MNLDVREMLGGDVARLRYIKRFSTCRTVGTETVAEHTAYVVLYCVFIADWAETHGTPVGIAKLLRRAAVHDIEESRSGDFPRSFKYATEELRSAVEKASSLEARKVFESLTDCAMTVESFHTEWKNAKDDSVEGAIVEFADFLSALAFIVEEKKMGNFCLSQHTGTFTQYLKKFEADRYQFLIPLIRQARQLVVEILA